MPLCVDEDDEKEECEELLPSYGTIAVEVEGETDARGSLRTTTFAFPKSES